MLLLLRFFTFFFKIQKVVTFYVFCRLAYVFSNYARHVGVAKSEHPRLTNNEIIFEEFQPM